MKKLRWHTAFWTSPGLVFIVFFFLVPLVSMVVISFTVGGVFSLGNYQHFLAQSSYVQALVNSIEVTLLVTTLSVIVSYPLAWVVAERVPRRWQPIALILTILPFWSSYVVRSYSWLLVLASHGVINQGLMSIGLTDHPLRLANTRLATVIGFVNFFTMLLTLIIYANLKMLNPSYRKAAADLGASGFQSFFHVVLPLTRPGIFVGAFLTFVLTIGDYVTPQILGGNNSVLMSQLIIQQVRRRADLPEAAALSMILVVIIAIVYGLCARWMKLERS